MPSCSAVFCTTHLKTRTVAPTYWMSERAPGGLSSRLPKFSGDGDSALYQDVLYQELDFASAKSRPKTPYTSKLLYGASCIRTDRRGGLCNRNERARSRTNAGRDRLAGGARRTSSFAFTAVFCRQSEDLAAPRSFRLNVPPSQQAQFSLEAL